MPSYYSCQAQIAVQVWCQYHEAAVMEIFVYKRFDQKSGNRKYLVRVLSNIWRLEQVRKTKWHEHLQWKVTWCSKMPGLQYLLFLCCLGKINRRWIYPTLPTQIRVRILTSRIISEKSYELLKRKRDYWLTHWPNDWQTWFHCTPFRLKAAAILSSLLGIASA